jgi:hypothetical protein
MPRPLLPASGRRRALVRGVALLAVLSGGALAAPPARSVPPPRTAGRLDSLAGASGRLKARIVSRPRAAGLPILRELFGDSAERHGVRAVADAGGQPFSFITMRPFSDKVNGRIGRYRIGFWPGERPLTRAALLPTLRRGGPTVPEGFIEVTRENQETPVSEHFRLRDFLTHDQEDVWPKYLVLQERLIDKLELIVAELVARGARVERMHVMSGFRTPQYNARGVGAGGRAQDSRHQYGDAADVYVVNGGRDWMADLDGDGRGDLRDARLLAAAAAAVEQRHPELVGGIGIYPATSAHGPFVHIDARGRRARWGAW